MNKIKNKKIDFNGNKIIQRGKNIETSRIYMAGKQI